MHIGIVLHPFGSSTKGLEQYIFESTRSLLEQSKDSDTFTIFVKGNPDTSLLPKKVTVVQLPNVPYWHLYLFRHRTKCDLFVFFTEVAPLFLWRKSIVLFFDAAYYYFGGTSLSSRLKRALLVWWRGHMLRHVQHVVTISEASKKDLVEKFRVPGDHVTVIYPGFKSLRVQYNEIQKGKEDLYFVYIGPMKERKNVANIVRAFILFKQESSLPHMLYLVGRKSSGLYEEEVFRLISESAYADSILCKTDVSDEELPALYANATALVFPSLLEGFGLPVLEALSLSCMVITSSTTSTKEALGNAGFLVDPHNPAEISNAMVNVARGMYDDDAFKKQAQTQCALFSWERSGKSWNIVLTDTVFSVTK